MKYTFLVLLALFLVISPAEAQLAQKNEVVSLRDGLKEMLQAHGAKSLKKLNVAVDATKAAELKDHGVEAEGTYTVYQGLAEDGSTTGHVLVISEEGKEGPLQLLVAINPEGEVYDVGFTVFGEDKGKSALSWPFLKQFIDKKNERHVCPGGRRGRYKRGHLDIDLRNGGDQTRGSAL